MDNPQFHRWIGTVDDIGHSGTGQTAFGRKLLEAHYSDAIPLDLMKTEQQKIAKELAAIDHEIDLHNITFEQISANLDMVLDIVENCGEAYRNASDTVKKLMN